MESITFPINYLITNEPINLISYLDISKANVSREPQHPDPGYGARHRQAQAVPPSPAHLGRDVGTIQEGVWNHLRRQHPEVPRRGDVDLARKKFKLKPRVRQNIALIIDGVKVLGNVRQTIKGVRNAVEEVGEGLLGLDVLPLKGKLSERRERWER